jgi:hypothetical protein
MNLPVYTVYILYVKNLGICMVLHLKWLSEHKGCASHCYPFFTITSLSHRGIILLLPTSIEEYTIICAILILITIIMPEIYMVTKKECKVLLPGQKGYAAKKM